MRANRESYPYQDSPLYCIRTKRKLWEILESDSKTVGMLLLKGPAAYKTVTVPGRNGKKPRQAQDPEPLLKKIQKRINSLLQRINHPHYVQAGLKGRSYITNAHQHAADEWVCCIDVHRFYPSCKSQRVEELFYHLFRCSADVCEIIAQLTTINGHLPTGGPASLLLSFWSYKNEFDKIAQISEKQSLKMSLYVDDLTFSGTKARIKFMNAVVKPILAGADLVGHKIKVFSPKTDPRVTGVMLTPDGPRVPFERERRIMLCYQGLRHDVSPQEKLQRFEVLISRLIEASSINPRYKSQVEAMADCRRNYLREHPRLSKNPQKRVRTPYVPGRPKCAPSSELDPENQNTSSVVPSNSAENTPATST